MWDRERGVVGCSKIGRSIGDLGPKPSANFKLSVNVNDEPEAAIEGACSDI